MRFRTGVANSDGVFFTDLNGFQLQRRQTLSKLPIQGNFYPMPTSALLRDSSHRLTLVSSHSSGVASLKEGRSLPLFSAVSHCLSSKAGWRR